MAASGRSEEPAPAELTITRSDEVILALSGELDLASAPDLERRINEVWSEGHTRVVLDLSELRFVDSAGVSALIRGKEEARAEGRLLVLRRPTARVHSLFALVGLVHWLGFEDEEPEPDAD